MSFCTTPGGISAWCANSIVKVPRPLHHESVARSWVRHFAALRVGDLVLTWSISSRG
jgi:hypothetical protein